MGYTFTRETNHMLDSDYRNYIVMSKSNHSYAINNQIVTKLNSRSWAGRRCFIIGGGELDGLVIETTNTCAACEKHGIHIATGFDEALVVSGGQILDMDYGYTVTAAHTATDRVTGAPQDGTAFLSSSTSNVAIADADDDYVLIGNDDTFEVVQVILDTASSKDCDLDFFYSTGDGTWDTLIVDDATAGFSKNGLIDWNAPAGWAETSHCEAGQDAITQGYYIKIQRTYAQNIPVEPVESYFKIYLEKGGDSGMKISGRGIIKNPYLPDDPFTLYGVALESGDQWMEDDGLHIYYNGAEKVIAGA